MYVMLLGSLSDSVGRAAAFKAGGRGIDSLQSSLLSMEIKKALSSVSLPQAISF